MSTAVGRRWPVALTLLALSIAGCAADERPPAPSGTANEISTRAEEAALRNPDRLDTSSFQDMSLLADGLDLRMKRAVRECMASQGFPQLVEANEMAVSYLAEGRHDPIRIDPLELGPYTTEQAQKYGMAGTPLQFSEGEPGTVLSKDKAFDSALEGCYKSFGRQADTDVAALLARFLQLRNTVRSQFVETTTPEIETLSTKRLECVRDNGYPALNPKQALEGGSFATLLRGVGITPAPIRQAEPEQPELQPGQVVVVPPAERAAYTPTKAEVDLAMTFVTCTEQLEFVDELEAIQSRARARVLAPHEPEVLELGRALRAAVKATAAEG